MGPTLFDGTFGAMNIGLTLFDGTFKLRISALPYYTALSELRAWKSLKKLQKLFGNELDGASIERMYVFSFEEYLYPIFRITCTRLF